MFFNRRSVLLSSVVSFWGCSCLRQFKAIVIKAYLTKNINARIFFPLVLGTACWASVAAHGQDKAAFAPAAQDASTDSRLFSSHCASCHGLDGHGGERAPDIAGNEELQKLPDAGLAKIIREGVPGTGMPSFRSLGETSIHVLVRRLRALQGQDPKAGLPGSPKAGRVLFFGEAGCSECHMVHGAGGFMGPDLSGYGSTRSPGEIQEALTNSANYPEYSREVVVATTLNGKTFTGIVRNEDNFSLQLQTKDGAFHLFDKSALRQLERRPESLMPTDYASRLSRQQINDLISYLLQVGRRPQPASQPNKRKVSQPSGRSQD